MATQALATIDNDGGVVKLEQQLQSRSEQFRQVLPSHITPEKLQRTVITAVFSAPDLLKADRRSLITACTKAAQDGLLPDGREAALVIFSTRQNVDGEWRSVKLVQYMPMVYGLRKKILQSGEVKDITTNVVYRQEIEAGLFIYEEGEDRMLRHRPLMDAEFDPKDEDIAAAYSIATLADGSRTYEVMRRSEINKVRQVSQTGATGRTVQYGAKQGQPIEPKGPWVDWFSEMARKTVMRRHSKTLPMSGDIIDVEANDEAEYVRSTANVLASDRPDEPARLPTRADTSGETIDDETGEVVDDEAVNALIGRIGEAMSNEDVADIAGEAMGWPDEPKAAVLNAALERNDEIAKAAEEADRQAGQRMDQNAGKGAPAAEDETTVTTETTDQPSTAKKSPRPPATDGAAADALSKPAEPEAAGNQSGGDLAPPPDVTQAMVDDLVGRIEKADNMPDVNSFASEAKKWPDDWVTIVNDAANARRAQLKTPARANG